ncbi:MAG: A/G-specific adenine glycosylase [Opitutales bacterium]
MAKSSPAPLLDSKDRFLAALHGWYRVHQRPLPWRTSPSLYRTVVSELMLQQTQVATVLPYFDRWLRALPDFAALAAAPEAKVLRLWEGLGYYSRARHLHQLAQAVVARPAPPRTPAEWRELPGIGPYTAAAITSIAFGEPAACVDGNVVRILARLTGEARLFRDGSEAAKHFTPLANALITSGETGPRLLPGVAESGSFSPLHQSETLPRSATTRRRSSPRDRELSGRIRAETPATDPGLHNQAMMELGATICLRQRPQCPLCPVAEFCAARHTGTPEKIPRLQPKVIEQKFVSRIFCLHRGTLLLRRGHTAARRLAGLYELPELADVGVLPDEKILLFRKRRAITRYRITESIYAVKPTAALRARIAKNPGLEWVPLDDLDQLTLSGPHRRWIGELLAKP